MGERYAYGNQPTIAQWNLAQVRRDPASAFLDPDPKRAVELANEAISRVYQALFQEHWLAGMPETSSGLSSNEEGDLDLAHALLRAMHENAADFTLTFRRLCVTLPRTRKLMPNVRALFANEPAAYDSWVARWRSRLAAETLDPDARARAMKNFINPGLHPAQSSCGASAQCGD